MRLPPAARALVVVSVWFAALAAPRLVPAEGYPGFAQAWDKPTRVMAPMRDGVKLATEIYLPPGAGPWPVLLHRTPYGMPGPTLNVPHKGGNKYWDELRLYEAGYAIVFQTSRGRHGSEGEAVAFGSDGWARHQDGYDMVEWLAKQPWCNGKIGTFGISGPGVTQYQMAGAAPPHLAAQHVGVACADPYSQGVFQGGAYRKELAENWIKGNGYDYPRHVKIFTDHAAYDAFWKMANLNEPEAYARTRAPALHWSGWWDIFGQGAVDAFVNLQHRGGPGAKGRQRLVMGPWPHGIVRAHGELTFPENALHPPLMDRLQWFDACLKGKGPSGDAEWPVAYYTVGACGENGAPGNEWRKAKDWPPAPATATPLYLTAEGGLSVTAPAAAGKREFVYDPRDPAPTLGGANLYLEKGAKDQRPLEGRPDMLVYTSPVLDRPLEVTGRVCATLWVATDAKDTDFTAKLTDVYPDGKSVLLLDGIQRLRFRNGPEREDFAPPGKACEVTVDLWTTSVIFNAGHRLRVAVSSSNAPRFLPNPNTGGPPFDAAPPVTARNEVHAGPGRGSRIVLPVVGEGPRFRE